MRWSGVFDINQYISGRNSSLNLLITPIVCKQFQEAFNQVFKIADINPQKTGSAQHILLFFDDSIHNLQTGKSTHLHTVLVCNLQRSNGVDHAFESIHNIREGLPELWEVEEKLDSVTCSKKVAIETSVRA